ncbi:hypothetical protein BQ8794_550007 [Mesorhizobium prunaredense]|uniref:Uncharacterized protein n=1 Tax=Mesorhizobium prunaredense TaxID=1631249 RepID=A0A1R3VFK7_9HYPH|nr:hypothetical protein BQ8794_550007 [Mesorhizobium prunaredense]
MVAVVVGVATLFIGCSAKQLARAGSQGRHLARRHLAAPNPHHPHHGVGTTDSGPAGSAEGVA